MHVEPASVRIMSITVGLLWVLMLSLHLVAEVSEAVPLSVVSAPLPPADISDLQELQEDIEDDDDSTTHLEHLSSAATCLVAGVEYTHGQQIYRADQCEFCLCLDGEMFCWWQDCPPVVEGPCRDRQPFSPCGANNGNGNKNAKLAVTPKSTAAAVSTSAPAITTTNSQSNGNTNQHQQQQQQQQNVTAANTAPNASAQGVANATEITTTDKSSTSTTEEPFCIVMGEKYSVGSRLPHDTGNCIECICSSPGPIISCSPHHPCAPPDDQQPDYRPPGPRLAVPDF